jgi:hypothetical protein
MDDETLNLLKTVCAAGRARSAFNDNSNERLRQLEKAGLLDLVSAPSEGLKSPARRSYYRPTNTGRAKCRELDDRDADAEQPHADYAFSPLILESMALAWVRTIR